jgi:preprotein translocase subunit SecE
MPNKDRNKRSVRKARAAERARVEEAQAASKAASTTESKGFGLKKAKPETKAKAPEKRMRTKKPGFFARIRDYFVDVRTEMHRVTWPSRPELRNWSVAVIAMLAIFGVCVWLVDTGFVALLVGFTGLRG